MNQIVDNLLLQINLTWGNGLFPLEQDRIEPLRKRWSKTLNGIDQQIIVSAFELFVSAGNKMPPTLPEIYKACNDLMKQQSLKVDHKAIECRGNRQAADVGFRNIMEILNR